MKTYSTEHPLFYSREQRPTYWVERGRKIRRLLPPVPFPDTSIPGIRHLMSGRYGTGGRISWAVALLVCLAAWMQQSLHLITLYNSEPLSVELSMRTNGSLVFPRLTLCPYKPLHFSYEYVKLVQRANTELGLNIQSLQDLWMNLPRLGMDVSTLWNIGKIRAEDIEIDEKCGIDNTSCGHRIKLRDMKTFIGTCLTIGIESPSLVLYSGPSTGLDVVVYDNRSFVDAYLLNQSSQETGYTLYLHDSFTNPTFDAFFQGTIIRHSAITTIHLNMKQFQFYNTTKRPCFDGKVVSKCEVECTSRKILSHSDCRLPYIQSTKPRLCTSSDSFNKSFQRPQAIYRSMSDCNCPESCLNTVYVSDSDVSRGLVNKTEIRVYIKDRRFELLFERPSYSLAEVLGDLGGLFGVFLGACLLSFLELAEMAIFYVRTVRRRWALRGWI